MSGLITWNLSDPDYSGQATTSPRGGLKKVLAAIILLLSLAWPGSAVATNLLQDMSFFALPGNNVQISLDFADPVAQPSSFVTDNPARIVLDFPGMELDLIEKTRNIGIGAVSGLNAVEAGGRTRVVVELVYSVPFEINTQENQLIISVGSKDPPSEEAVPGEPMMAGEPGEGMDKTVMTFPDGQVTPVDTPVVPSAPQIQEIDFRRSENGAGRIIAVLNSPDTVIDMHEEGEDIVVTFKDVELPDRLDRRLDVTDFATPVTSVDTSQKGNHVRMVIQASGQYEHLAYQSANVYTVEVKQFAPQDPQEVSLAEKTYTGERLSLNFQDIDIHAVLNLLADFKGFNMIIPDTVKGSVSLRLKNVPWDQALDIILDSHALGLRQVGNVLMIDKKRNIEERKRQELAAKQEIQKLEPVRTEFIQINYSKASELSSLLKTKDEHSFLSERGRVSVDGRTNTLIVQDTANRLEQVRRLVVALDQPVRQVLIESRVVIATDDFTRELGVKFGQSTNYRIGDDGWGMITGGKRPGDTTYPSEYAFNTGGQENFIVDLPANISDATGGGAFGLAIGKVGSYLLQLELSALQQEGRGEIVSSPRVITANQKTATIKQGVEVAVPGVAGVGATAAPTFKEAVLELSVTPQITPDDRIIMDLNVKKDNERAAAGTFAFDKREVETQVLVDNGETVVLGGVYERTLTNAVNRIPFFGDLPVIGYLFRNTTNVDNKRELLIFVTPKILKEKTSWERS